MPRGSAPGERRGGRQKGTPNRVTLLKQEVLEAAEKSALAGLPEDRIDALSPLDIMLMAMRAAAKAGNLMTAAAVAKEAAPYVLPKLASTTVTHRDAISDLSYDELVSFMRILDRASESIRSDPSRADEILASIPMQGRA